MKRNFLFLLTILMLVACGHFIHMEQSELFNQKLKEFLNQ